MEQAVTQQIMVYLQEKAQEAKEKETQERLKGALAK